MSIELLRHNSELKERTYITIKRNIVYLKRNDFTANRDLEVPLNNGVQLGLGATFRMCPYSGLNTKQPHKMTNQQNI